MSALDSQASAAFTEPEDGFADDDLLAPDDISVDLSGVPPSRSFLERSDYESELGTVDPFEEDFTSIATHEIVEVIADGDRVGRPIIVIYAYRLPSSKSIDHAQLLRYLQSVLDKVAANHKVNLMTANNLSVVFGPNLTWPTDQQVPIAQLNNLNNFCYRLIVDYDKIFK
ncbi:RhoGAP domain protein [Oesophagostomum dentatum]|uniref:RhoGAP domain protein n=1 Tax=Oesophagostomum dentatum TaxID=61180 RepID=A0A0B1T1Y4_OESDE|nr:RhoGAP domain protein [Oesophagostomum dentatum]